MEELWRTLKVGDKVRMVCWPPELSVDTTPRYTHQVCQWLIDTKHVMTITKIDELEMPWGSFKRREAHGMVHHSLLLNHGGLEVVRRSKRASRSTGRRSRSP